MSDVFEEVKAVIADVLKIDPSEITPETRIIEDLKADSMDQFFLIDGLSQKFDLAISDEDARQIKTVADAVRYIETHKKQ
ncbi:MAG: acyl carrier protein [Thermanaerothrix sp.]|jgi:acyl carrier protein|uniref:Acyl carrier protein n=1 Tax=Thermanaerothrix solaris TaxID=3058434 RepID=A0ABU3NIW5_9CHLR|nr:MULTISPECIES: acyl carrier protein [unclassified Thermanaerothrix]MDT8896795.1 acyl carrier protein [Thermanaerothrix sp. 4228-RoL]